MTLASQYKEYLKQKLLRSSAFKNRFLKLWEEYGVIYTHGGEKFFDNYRISGTGVGATEMSKTFKSPSMSSELSNEEGVSSVDLIFDFNKLIILTDNMLSSWLDNYRSEMFSKSFDGLYYKIYEYRVEDAYFLREIDTEIGEPTEYEEINDSFLNQLAFDIAERERLSYYNGAYIDFGVGGVSIIEFHEEISIIDVNYLLNKLIEHEYLADFSSRDKNMTLLDIRDRILKYAIDNNIDVDILGDYRFLVFIKNKGLVLSF
jgi:hypothetical protein